MPSMANTHPMIKKLQKAQSDHKHALQVMDSDVLALIGERANNQKDVERLNSMIRLLFA